MGIGPTSEQQEQAEREKQIELAEERVLRRQMLGQTPVDEPLLQPVMDE